MLERRPRGRRGHVRPPRRTGQMRCVNMELMRGKYGELSGALIGIQAGRIKH
jgi:hypothetical protein